MKRSEWPSQIKYRESNPSVSFRLARRDKEKLDAIVGTTGKSLSKWISDFVNDRLDPEDVNSDLAELVEWYRLTYLELDDKYRKLETEARFSIPCSVCGKNMNFSSKKSNWTSGVYPALEKTFGTWSHGECKSK